jgi:hypothetical protein
MGQAWILEWSQPDMTEVLAVSLKWRGDASS